MNGKLNRRGFLRTTTAAGVATGLGASTRKTLAGKQAKEPPFKISLAEWSLHRTLKSGKLDNLDFPVVAKRDLGIDCVEYVNQFFMDKARDEAYLKQLKQRCNDNGVTSGLIMCDNEGDLGDPDGAKRTKAIENHYKWIEAAKFLGCHSIRVNARSTGTPEEQHKLAVEGLRRLSEFGAKHDMNVIVENHGGLSSNGEWLAAVIKEVVDGGLKNCGTLPDFGNFPKDYDKYEGVREMMPYAKGVSAKSHAFDTSGQEAEIDYFRMLEIVRDAGYRGYVGIEWEGEKPGEMDGIRLTKRLLERIRDSFQGG